MGMLIEEGKGNNRVKKLRTDNNPLINRTQGSEKIEKQRTKIRIELERS